MKLTRRLLAGLVLALLVPLAGGGFPNANAADQPPPFIADVVGINDRGDMIAFVQNSRSDRGFYRIDGSRNMTEIELVGPEPNWAALRDGFWNVFTPQGPNAVGDVLVRGFVNGEFQAWLRAADGTSIRLPAGSPAGFGDRSHVAYTNEPVDYPPTDITLYDRDGAQIWNTSLVRPGFVWSPVQVNGVAQAAVTRAIPLDPNFESFDVEPYRIDANGRLVALPLSGYRGGETWDITDSGKVLGTAYRQDAAGNFFTDLVVWSPGQPPRVLLPNLTFPLFPIAMNESEQVVLGEFGSQNPVVVDQGRATPLRRPGDTDMFAGGINARGMVVGVVKTATTPYQGFVWHGRQGLQLVGPPPSPGKSRCSVPGKLIFCVPPGVTGSWAPGDVSTIRVPDRPPRQVSDDFVRSTS